MLQNFKYKNILLHTYQQVNYGLESKQKKMNCRNLFKLSIDLFTAIDYTHKSGLSFSGTFQLQNIFYEVNFCYIKNFMLIFFIYI